MTLEFFKLFQRNIEDDLNIIIPSNTDFLDELVEDCLPLLKGCVLIGACPSEQIAAIIFSFLVFPLNLLQLVLCCGQGILCCLDCSLIFIQKLLDHITVNAALSPDDANHFILQCIPFVVLEVELTLCA